MKHNNIDDTKIFMRNQGEAKVEFGENSRDQQVQGLGRTFDVNFHSTYKGDPKKITQNSTFPRIKPAVMFSCEEGNFVTIFFECSRAVEKIEENCYMNDSTGNKFCLKHFFLKSIILNIFVIK